MGAVMPSTLQATPYRSIAVRAEGGVCTIRLDRPTSGNAIDRELIDDCTRALHEWGPRASVVVLEGSPEVFCVGADFAALRQGQGNGQPLHAADPQALYTLWQQLAGGPFVSVAHVRGKVNAGGVGFVAACDVVLADVHAVFSLSELLFGLLPACVLPFLVRRIGAARAQYLSLSTQPLPARQAEAWGLVDACDEHSDRLLHRHLLRLQRLSKAAIQRHKSYAAEIDETLARCKPAAVRANVEAFTDPVNLAHIDRYLSSGRFPWETGP